MEPTPLEAITEAQDRLAAFAVSFRRAFWTVALAAAILGLALSGALPKLCPLLYGLAAGMLATAFGLLLRARKDLRAAQLFVNHVFRDQRSKSPETCGSMDPHFTRARN